MNTTSTTGWPYFHRQAPSEVVPVREMRPLACYEGERGAVRPSLARVVLVRVTARRDLGWGR